MTHPSSSHQHPIAVVGISALFPGALDATSYWKNILAKTDQIRDVPPSHWLIGDYFDPDPTVPDKTCAKRGAFIDPVEFDALSWSVPPAAIPATDTSQLLALIVAQKVLEDALREQFETADRSRVSVILGVTSSQELLSSMVSRLQRPVWVKALRESGLPEDEVIQICDRIASHYVPWQEATFPGLLGNVVAGRIANRLNLGGTNCVTDAACASSFSALTMAVDELQLGRSDLVISGGVDTLNDIFMFVCFSKTQAISTTNDCRPFSDRADGTILGEGLGMVALKRLEDAERDGNRIYAVIRGVGSSSDGRSGSVYAPVPAGQARSIARAYEVAGYGPETVELIEAHGTGTKAGDVAEFDGLRLVFDTANKENRPWCALGSVKSQIGHTKAAAGVAGLLKVIMAVHHGVLPPTIKIDAPNPKLRLEGSPFYLNTMARPWVRDSKHPRRASVSAFGFGGSNFHVTLEEYQGNAPHAERLRILPRELIIICGREAAEVASRAQALANQAHNEKEITRLAHESQTDYAQACGKEQAMVRLAVLAGDATTLRTCLLEASKRIGKSPDEAFSLPDGTAYGLGESTGKLAFLFPGQGSQYLGMGADLAMNHPAALRVWDLAANITMEPGTSLQEVVFPRPGFAKETERNHLARLTATQWAQPAIAGVSLSLLALLKEIGIAPDMAAGHSLGEVVALHAAGALTAADLLKTVRQRGELMAQAAAIPGAMTALSLPIDEVRELLERLAPGVVVANHNGPAQVVVSGSSADIASLESKLAGEGISCKRLPVATAFHSGLVASACEPFMDFLNTVPFEPARLPVFSNALATPHSTKPADLRTALSRQISDPVRFVEMIESMYAAGARTFLEIGPGSVLTGLVGQILKGRPHQAINTDRKGKHGIDSLLMALSNLAAIGVPMSPAKLFTHFRLPSPEKHSSGAKLLVSLSGSNPGKPYPPPGGSASLPAPNPARPAPLTPSPAPLSSEWALAFQETQRQTAEAHAAYQKSMAESHAAYLRVAEAGMLGLSTLLSGQTIETDRATLPKWEAPPPQWPEPPSLVSSPNAFVPELPKEGPPAPRSDLQTLLLDVISDKTGYPADMLDLGMDLEADLGIDSIKWVEILSALMNQVPGLSDVNMGQMTALRTLRAILEYMQGKESPGTITAPPLERLVLERITAPATGFAQAGIYDDHEIWVIGGAELDEILARELRSRGVRAQAAQSLPTGATACIYLGGLVDVASIDEAIAVNHMAFTIAKTLANRLETDQGLFVTVQDTGGSFGMTPLDPHRAWLTGLPALIKTAALEWPEASVKAIDLERGGRQPEELARVIALEILEGGGESEIALSASGSRFTLRTVPKPVELAQGPIGPSDVVVVSGGGRGITARCLVTWARECHARFVLLGRSQLTDDPSCCKDVENEADLKKALLAEARKQGQHIAPAELGALASQVLANREIRQTLREIESAGSMARYETIHVEDASSLRDVLARVRSDWGEITGLVHAAGVLADKRLSQKTDDQFNRVFNTKVSGLRSLLDATAKDPLKLLCVFSSVAARFGNAGQADYAMANEVMSKVVWAESARRPEMLVRSIAWGPWHGGMVTTQLEEHFRALGVPLIPLTLGARMFADEVRSTSQKDIEVLIGSTPTTPTDR